MCNGIFVNENIDNSISLLYADDIGCVADTVFRLQKQINFVEMFCNKYGMKINLDKTKIVVFRRGGNIKSNEKWTCKGEAIETVSF